MPAFIPVTDALNEGERTWVNVDHIVKVYTETDLDVWTYEDPVDLLRRIDRLLTGPV